MRLLIVNGSPRDTQGVSELVARKLASGFESGGGSSWEILRLAEPKEAARAAAAFGEAELVVIVTPLYTDCMPALVKGFIEELAPYVGRESNPALGFFVHSGLPEATHSRAVERYYERLAARLGSRYLGTAVRGGTEGLRYSTPDRIDELLGPAKSLGEGLARAEEFAPTVLAELARPERLSKRTATLLRFAFYLPLSQLYWNNRLRETGAFYRRFVRPYR